MPGDESSGRRGEEGAGPSVGAIVVNFNGGERVIRCLEALLRQDPPLNEILLVDNGSGDGSVRRIRDGFPSVGIVELGENFGPAKARNVGLARLSTDLALSLDGDMYLARDCLARMVETYLAHHPAAVCPRTVLHEPPPTVQCDGAEIHFTGTLSLRHGLARVEDHPGEVHEVGGVNGGCLLLDREKTLAAGSFDEAYFFYFEDLEFSYRLRALGHRFFCDSRAVVEHDPGAGTAGLSFRGAGEYPARRAYLTMRHRLRTMLLHYEVRTFLLLLPALALYEAASFAVALSRGWIPEWFRAWGWQVQNRKDISRKRRSLRERRLRRDREILSGGPLPLAPGFSRSAPSRLAVQALSGVLDGYWRIARSLLGGDRFR
jgi:GT2 family glycosyltransferase